jgi:hypothetical protein
MLNGEKKAGNAVVNQEEVIEAWTSLAGTLAQKGELVALTRALALGKEKKT